MSTAALAVRVALVDQTESIPRGQLDKVAGALSEQVASDFGPVWHVRASVAATEKPDPGQWTIGLTDIDEPGALGYHSDQHNQPYAVVQPTDTWPQTVSHELLEMLADPFGNRLHGGRLPRAVIGDAWKRIGLPTKEHHVHYLLEVCDPCEALPYEVAGVELSDFLLPHWYRTTPGHFPGFSFAGRLEQPREIYEGGYVSFCADDGEWWQCFVQDGQPELRDLGRFDGNGSLREWTDERAREQRAAA